MRLVSVNIWFLCFVIAAVCCCIHVCSVAGEISQRKRRRRAKTTELKQLFSKNSPGGFKVRPGTPPFILAQRPRIETSRIAFYVQRARLISTSTIDREEVVELQPPPVTPAVSLLLKPRVLIGKHWYVYSCTCFLTLDFYQTLELQRLSPLAHFLFRRGDEC